MGEGGPRGKEVQVEVERYGSQVTRLVSNTTDYYISTVVLYSFRDGRTSYK